MHRIEPDALRPLLIVGQAPQAHSHTLRRVLHAKRRGQGLIVVDYQGQLGQYLHLRNKGNLQNGPVLWCDLGQRRRPWSLPLWQRSAGLGMSSARRPRLPSLNQYNFTMAPMPTAPPTMACTRMLPEFWSRYMSPLP